MISALTFLFSFLAITAPDAGLDTDAGPEAVETPRRMETPPELETTKEAEHLRVKNLHVVIERKGDRVRVSQVVTLASTPGKLFRGGEVRLVLPRGAEAPGLDASMESMGAVFIREGAVFVDAEVPPDGLDVTYFFELPIREGVASFEQTFPGEIGSARLVCTWTEGGTRMSAPGFTEAKAVELGTGIHALMTMGAGLPGGKISVRVEGFRSMPGETSRWVVLFLCGIFVLSGVAARFIRRSGAKRP